MYTDNFNERSLGEVLIQKRTLLDLSLEDVQKKTGIKAEYVGALENGKLADLPAPVYVHGYLKSLSRLYGLELSKLLNAYKEEEGLRRPWLRYDDHRQTQINDQFLKLTPKNVTTAAFLVVFLLIFGYMAGQIRGLRSAPELSLEKPTANFQTSADSVEVTGRTEPGAVVTVNNQIIHVEADGTFRLNLHMSLGENELVVRSLNRFNRHSEVRRRVIVGISAAPEVLGEEKQQEN
jgi:cytoskeletal protein RodZ